MDSDLTLAEVRRRADDLDRRRRHQVDHQRESINRLLVDGDGAAEIATLNEQLASATARLEHVADLVVGRRTSPLVRQLQRVLDGM